MSNEFQSSRKGVFSGFGRNVWVTGLVSFFMDISSEMGYSRVPLFLVNTLGASKSVVGLIEGIAESTASVLRVFSGYLSDRLGNRKWVMAAGYALSTLSRPLIASGSNWGEVLVYRFADRFGKGVRSAPRDAIIVESTEKDYFGRAFSFHRALDTFGAVIGPLIAFMVLSAYSNDYRLVFWLSIIPGALAVLLIILFVREPSRGKAEGRTKHELTWGRFDWKFRVFMLISAIFALGNISDAFLILRAQELGIPSSRIPLVYLCFNLVYSLTAFPAGMLADSFGRKRIILSGFILFAFLLYGFAVARESGIVWMLFGVYGVFMGLTEGIQKAFLATIIPGEFKATAYGIYNAVTGLAMFPASLFAGWLWDHYSSSAPFYYGAGMAALAAVLFIFYIALVDREKAARK